MEKHKGFLWIPDKAGEELVEWYRASEVDARIAELEKAHARYEYVRTLNVPQFRALLIDNLHFNVPFDDLVDNAIKNKSLMESGR